jgi:hypothetical protein
LVFQTHGAQTPQLRADWAWADHDDTGEQVGGRGCVAPGWWNYPGGWLAIASRAVTSFDETAAFWPGAIVPWADWIDQHGQRSQPVAASTGSRRDETGPPIIGHEADDDTPQPR